MQSRRFILGFVLILSALIFMGCGPVATPAAPPSAAPTTAQPTPVTQTMSLAEAREIATKSECGKAGALKENAFYNESTGTWWIDLDVVRPGCNPACVVNVANKTAEINWRCTGLLVPTASPTVAPSATPAPTATPVTTKKATYKQVSFAYDPSLATNVTAKTIPGETGQDIPPWEIHPEYVEFAFEGYKSKNTYHEPKIYVYPAAEYQRISPGAQKIIGELTQLLADKPAAPQKAIPLLPIFNAGQVFHAQVQYLTFQGGKGVRFVTQYDQAYLPINNLEVFYTFQGLTDDGRFYVAAILPVSSGILPDTDQVDPRQQKAFGENFPKYVQETTQKLNGLKPQEFTPNLDALDAMLRTLRME